MAGGADDHQRYRCGAAAGSKQPRRLVSRPSALPDRGNLASWRPFGKYVETELFMTQFGHNDGAELMITGAQCRSARTLLTWSVSKLAGAASVSDSDIDDFELERRRPSAATLEAIQHAFEDVGVKFLPGDDVCLGTHASAGK
jgi:hypothetical protein